MVDLYQPACNPHMLIWKPTLPGTDLLHPDRHPRLRNRGSEHDALV